MRGATKFVRAVLRSLGLRATPRWIRQPTYGAPGLRTGRAVPPPWARARNGPHGSVGFAARPAVGSAVGSGAEALLPCDVRKEVHIPFNRAKMYGIDRSGTVSYDFNSAGYRREELDPQASFRVCVLGESHATGTGIPFECTFGQRLKAHLSAALDLPETAVNVVNLSAGGTSADYCIRTLIRQIDIVRPDLVLLNMPAADRMEDYGPEEAQNYTVSGVDLERIEEMPEPIQGFFDLYNPHLGYMNQARNALMFQMVCHMRGAEHIIVTSKLEPTRFATPILKPIFAQLDRDRIMINKFFNRRADIAADGVHAGPRSHEALAIALLERYARLVQQTGGDAHAGALLRQADRLKQDSDDWAFVRDTIGRARAGVAPRNTKARA